MAPDQGTPKQPDGGSVERQVANLLEHLQTPIRQVQEWVNGGQLQSTIEHLQEQAERAQEGVERRLRALGEVRQGLEIHLRKQLEAYRREKEELARRLEAASTGGRPKQPSTAQPAPSSKASHATGPKAPARPSAKHAAKKGGPNRPTGKKR